MSTKNAAGGQKKLFRFGLSLRVCIRVCYFFADSFLCVFLLFSSGPREAAGVVAFQDLASLCIFMPCYLRNYEFKKKCGCVRSI